MKYVFNDPLFKDRRKRLRNNLALPEVILWNQIKGSKLGVKFRRQYGIGPYVVDFYFHEKKLAIELDGESHNNPQAFKYDTKRSEYISKQGVKTIRFQNKDVLRNLDGVVTEI